jgi:hypothetical protein
LLIGLGGERAGCFSGKKWRGVERFGGEGYVVGEGSHSSV